MGSTPRDDQAEADEKPQHRVRITRPFYLGATEVTVGQFRGSSRRPATRPRPRRTARGAGAGTRRREVLEQNPKYTWRNPGFAQTDEHPVVNVSWNDAVAFCAWLSRKEGTRTLPAADGGGVGVRLPGGDDDAVLSAATTPRGWRRSGTLRTGRQGEVSRTGGRSRHGMATSSRRRSADFGRTPSGCTICTGMSGSGARTGTTADITSVAGGGSAGPCGGLAPGESRLWLDRQPPPLPVGGPQLGPARAPEQHARIPPGTRPVWPLSQSNMAKRSRDGSSLGISRRGPPRWSGPLVGLRHTASFETVPRRFASTAVGDVAGSSEPTATMRASVGSTEANWDQSTSVSSDRRARGESGDSLGRTTPAVRHWHSLASEADFHSR